MKRVILYSGPSGEGKTLLRKAFDEIYGYNFGRIILYTSRRIRTSKGERQDVEYHFRSEKEIRGLDRSKYIVGKVRSDWQAISVQELQDVLRNNDQLLVEVYPSLGKNFIEWLKTNSTYDFEVVLIAIVPMSNQEMKLAAKICGTTPETVVEMAIRGKLERRASESDTSDKIKERARLAYREIRMMDDYNKHIVIHYGEDRSDVWTKRPYSRTIRKIVDEFRRAIIE